MTNIKAVVFDMDGVILDSEAVYDICWRIEAEKRNISNIDYCGEKNNIKYKLIECNLYEKNNNTNTLISSYKSEKNITLDNYLKEIKLNIDNYLNVCKNYSDDSLYLEINAKDDKDIITTFKIPLKLNDNCK